jgi:hypothetical protein
MAPMSEDGSARDTGTDGQPGAAPRPAELISMGLRPIDPGASWQLALRDRLLRESTSSATNDTTAMHEQALGFVTPFAYWFLMAADWDYREAVILTEVTSPGDQPSLSPFDTGGLAAGYIRSSVQVPLDDFVQTFTMDWPTGTAAFVDWVQSAFEPIDHYWNRRQRVIPFTTVAPIDLSHGDSRAWTWEARLEGAKVAATPALRHVTLIMRPELSEAFLLWLPENPGSASDDELLSLLDWLDDSVVLTSDAVEAAGRIFKEIAQAWN